MNTLRKSIVIALTVAGLGSSCMMSAQAQTAAPAKPQAAAKAAPAREQQAHERMGEMMARHQARLHDALKLSAQQEAAWTSYQAAIKPVAPATPPVHLDRKAIAATPAPERLARMIDLSRQRTAHMESHLKAVTAFYGQLSTEQKAVFDDHTLGGKHGGGPRFGHHRWGHRGWGHDDRGHRGWGHDDRGHDDHGRGGWGSSGGRD